MALVTYPLNDIDYTAEDAELFHCTRTSGVHSQSSFPCSVTGANNNVTIGAGIAWIHNTDFSGKVAALKASLTVNLGVPDSTYPRIDAIILQFNANSNETNVAIKKGTAASSPKAPSVTRSASIYELHLYHVRREPGATAITAADITDQRLNSTYCGLMADSVTKIDTAAINSQVKSLLDRLEAEIENRLESVDNAINNATQSGVPVPTSATAGFFPRVTVDGTSYELVDLLNLHVWKKYTGSPGLTETAKTSVIVSKSGGSDGGTHDAVDYADEIEVKDGVISLVNPMTIDVASKSLLESNTLGKYIYVHYGDAFYHIPSNATVSQTGTSTYGIFIQYSAANLLTVEGEKVGFVASANRSAYPDSGEHSDGYWYEYSKQLGE